MPELSASLAWYYRNREAVLAKKKAQRIADPKKFIERGRRFAASPEGREYAREYHSRLYASDPQHAKYIRALAALSQIISGRMTGKQGSKYVKTLGCSPAQFRAHLEQKFKPGMTWENRGSRRGCWQVDHIAEATRFNLTRPPEFARFFHYSNTQPLWWDENNRKRGGAK